MLRNLAEMWKFRSLIAALVGRHLNARYRGSFFGFLWSFLNPLFLIATYSLVFRYYIRFNSVEHYTLFMFAGLLPWIWFSSGLLEATASISSGGSLITKAIFPPHILVVVSVITSLANFLFALPMVFLLMWYEGLAPGLALMLLPLIIVVEFFLMLGMGLGLAALNVYYRDIQHILGSVMTLWFFLCPIIYPASVIPERFRFTMVVNPIATFTELYQASLLDRPMPDVSLLLMVTALSFLVFIIGNLVFNYYREDFAELV